MYEHPTTMSSLTRSHVLSRAGKAFLFSSLCPVCFAKAERRSESESEYGQQRLREDAKTWIRGSPDLANGCISHFVEAGAAGGH